MLHYLPSPAMVQVMQVLPGTLNCTAKSFLDFNHISQTTSWAVQVRAHRDFASTGTPICAGKEPGRRQLRLGCSESQRAMQGRSFLPPRGEVERLRRCQVSADRSPRRGGSGPQALFTGIVEEMGAVRQLAEVDGSWELTVEASEVLQDVKLGDSIAINGTCLTVTSFDSDSFMVGLSPETLRKTSLGEVGPGSAVNLERSLRPDSRMGGHFVQGHVDGTGTIAAFRVEGDSLWVTVQTTPELLRYIVPKGYIAVDGTSLTVVDVLHESSSFTFMLVAYTQSKIVVPLKKPGDKVNLEVDIVGKYVERMLVGYVGRAVPVATGAEVDSIKVGS